MLWCSCSLLSNYGTKQNLYISFINNKNSKHTCNLNIVAESGVLQNAHELLKHVTKKYPYYLVIK